MFVWFFSSDALSFQVYRYLDFLASLLEHPRAKVSIFFFFLIYVVPLLFYLVKKHLFSNTCLFLFQALLLKEGAIQMLTGVLDRCLGATDIDGIQILAGRSSAKCGFLLLNWCLPVFKSFSLIFISQASLHNDL